MLREHAVTYREKISIDQLDYLVKKAVRIGGLGKIITRVYQEEDDEGFHVYYEVIKPDYGQAETS
jgi:transcriptional regulator